MPDAAAVVIGEQRSAGVPDAAAVVSDGPGAGKRYRLLLFVPLFVALLSQGSSLASTVYPLLSSTLLSFWSSMRLTVLS